MRKLWWRVIGAAAWLLVELAFRTDCWGPFAWSYRLGCALYGVEIDIGERWGFLIANPRAHMPGEPQLIEARP